MLLLQFKSLSENFKVPTAGTEHSAGFDIYMPEAGQVTSYNNATEVALGFAVAIPEGHVGFLLPRSGVGSREGLELNNTCGVIDADYRGEVVAKIRLKQFGVHSRSFEWKQGERLLQLLILPVVKPYVSLVSKLPDTKRGDGGFGHTGK